MEDEFDVIGAAEDCAGGGERDGDKRHGDSHRAGEMHHHHSHGPVTRHEGGHHLLAVEDLSVAFRMYGEPAGESARLQGEPGASCGRLRRYLAAPQREVEVIHGLSLSVHAGEVVAVVGASGSGKTLLADAVLGLFEPNALVRGRIWFDGEPMDASFLAAERGRGIALVPQSVASLDPLMRVGRQVEGVPAGRGAARRADARRRRARRRELFARYGLSEDVARLYPHELSGGMARRVLLCRALMGAPRLIVADEPTPGLDLSLARAAMSDFRAFADAGGGVLLITHDIELALAVADRVAVFRDGTVVEETSTGSFDDPSLLRHPFSRALWHALPEHDFAAPGEEGFADWLQSTQLPSIEAGAAGARASASEKRADSALTCDEGRRGAQC